MARAILAPAAPPPAASQRRSARSLRYLGTRALSAGVLLLLWLAFYALLRHTRVIPSPAGVVAALVDNRSLDWPNAGVTLRQAGLGFLWGNLVAIVLGILFVYVRPLEKLLMHVAVAAYCVPLVAIGPILVILLPGDSPKDALSALAVFFTTLIAMMVGLRSSDAAAADVVHAWGGSTWQAIRFVRIPAALPSLFGGLAIAAPASILGAIIGEYMGANSGLGVALIQAQSSFEIAQTWAIAILISALAGVAFAIVKLIARFATPWVGFQVNQGMGRAGGASERRLAAAGVELAWLLGAIVVMIGLWQGAIVVFHLNDYFAKTPLQVLASVTTGAGASANRSQLLSAFWITLEDSGLGYLIGTVVATAVAVVVANVASVERVLMPLAIALRSIPLVAMAPLISLVFGAGVVGVTVIVGLVVFFPTLVNMVIGLRSAPVATRELIRSFGGSRLDTIGRVDLRYGLPAFFASARIAIPSALGGATLAEWLATGRGLGNLLTTASTDSQYLLLWAGTVLIVVFAMACYQLLGWLEVLLLARFSARTP